MSNAPLKIAFWVMSLAFGLTILLTGLKPEEIRTALNPPQNENSEETEAEATPELAFEFANNESPPQQPVTQPAVLSRDVESRPLATHDDSRALHAATKHLPAQVPTWAGMDEPTVAVRTRATTMKPLVEPKTWHGIRVASADLDGSLGLEDRRDEIAEPILPIPDKRFSAVQRTPSEKKLSIPVPEPHPSFFPVPPTALSEEVDQLKSEVLRLKLIETRHQFDELRRDKVHEEFARVEDELRQLNEEITQFRIVDAPVVARTDQHPKVAAPVATAELSDRVETAEPLQTFEFTNKNPEPVIEVIPSEKREAFDFRFKDAEVGDVLKILGAQAGRKVVLSPDVSGTFSGDFSETSPNQAFAAVIKANQFGLSFRGDYILVRGTRDAKIR